MIPNVGSGDAILRVFLGAALISIALFKPGTGYDWLGWIGLAPLITGAIGWCPLYRLLNVSTCSRHDRPGRQA